ncbi:MAG: HAD-IA family hydrolase [Acetobacteraceae bacterium]|nr:HAD-IA family hydrolase [Acetobacteraceae bacterium]
MVTSGYGSTTLPPTIVFDLDGTLIDSASDLAAALNRTLGVLGLLPLPVAEVAAMVGDGARVLLARAFAAHGRAPTPDQLDEATAAYLRDYQANLAVATVLYPGVAETLAAMRRAGSRMAVCTNKPEAAARAILRQLGVADAFVAVGGGDSFPVRKPDPAHLSATMQAAGMTRAVMVGDHANDVLAARGCGIPSIWAAWGYGAADPGADAVAREFAALPALVGVLTARAG